MKKTITLHMPARSVPRVAKGDKIAPDTVLYTGSHSSSQIQEIPISRLLGVKEKEILRFLTRSIGEKIQAGEIVATKKGLWSHDFVRSPMTGEIASVDLNHGTVVVRPATSHKGEYRIPIDAVVKDIDDDEITLEIEGDSFEGESGKGNDTFGTLTFLSGKNTDALDVGEDVLGSVLLCAHISDDAIIKSEVLGVSGCILAKGSMAGQLPWVSVEESVFKKLASLNGKKAWLIPKEFTIIITS